MDFIWEIAFPIIFYDIVQVLLVCDVCTYCVMRLEAGYKAGVAVCMVALMSSGMTIIFPEHLFLWSGAMHVQQSLLWF